MLNSDVNELRKVSYKNYEKYEEEKQSYSILLKKYEECSTKTAKKEAEIEEINSVCIRK